MTDLFNKEDVLTILTTDKAKIGDKGYFGNSLTRLAIEVKRGEVHILAKIYEDYTPYPFKGDHHVNCFALFLPVDKVKEPVYRPIKTIDELFNFLVPGLDTDCDILEKVKLILSRIYELKGKQTGNICYRRFSQIYISDNYIRLDEYNLEHLVKIYEIKKDGEFVPFGIKEE